MKRPDGKVFLLVLAVFLLAGCWDSDEPERMYYIYGVGIEYKEHQYEVIAQVIDFQNVAKTEQPNPTAEQVAVGTAKGDTVYEAFFNLYHSLDMKLFWGHLSYIVFSENVLKEGRGNTVINSLNRYRETRYQIWVYITDENVSDVLKSTPVLNKSMTASKLANPTNSFQQESYFEPINFRELIIGLNDPSHEVAAPFVRLKKNWQMGDKENDHIDFVGMGIANNKELLTVLNKDEMVGMRWLNDRTNRTSITYTMDDIEMTVTVEKLNVDVKVRNQAGTPKFDVKLTFDAIVSDFNKEITKDEVTRSIKEEVQKEIEKTYSIGLERDVDVYRLSEVVYRYENQLFKQIEKDGKVPLDETSIESVTIDIQRLSAARKEFTQTVGGNE